MRTAIYLQESSSTDTEKAFADKLKSSLDYCERKGDLVVLVIKEITDRGRMGDKSRGILEELLEEGWIDCIVGWERKCQAIAEYL